MRPLFNPLFTFLAFITVFLSSCSDKTEEFITEPLISYMPLSPGKYIVYRVDSIVTTDFGIALEVRSRQVKHQVDAEITDNLGRKSYRILKYFRNADGTDSWQADGTYMITPLEKQIEVIEDNLRFIKLHAPVRDGYSWKGNSYLNLNPYSSFGYDFSLYAYLKDWDYYYKGFESTFTYEGNNYADVYTIEQENFIENFPVIIPEAPGSHFRGVEKYAKNIGLVYKEYKLLEYEPNTGNPNPYYTGFGVTLWMIDHN